MFMIACLLKRITKRKNGFQGGNIIMILWGRKITQSGIKYLSILCTILLLLSSFIVLTPKSALAATTVLPSRSNVPTNKTWTITFNQALNQTQNLASFISVTDSQNNLVSVTVSYGTDGKSVTVNPPQNGYTPGGQYVLHIGQGIASSTGSLLSDPVQMDFTIASQVTIKSVQAVNITTTAGTAPVLPSTVTATMSDGTTQSVAVTWASVAASQYASTGSFAVNGSVENSSITVTADVTVIKGTANNLINQVTAMNGLLQVTLASNPTTAPSTSAFSVQISLNGGAMNAVPVQYLGGNGNNLILSVPALSPTQNEQVIYRVSYSGSTTIDSQPLEINASTNASANNPVIQKLVVMNGIILVGLTESPATPPEVNQFSVTESINGSSTTDVQLNYLGGSGPSVALQIPNIQPISTEQNAIYNVSYQGEAYVSSTPLIIEATNNTTGSGSNEWLTSIKATDGDITITLTNNPSTPVTTSQFNVQESINNGPFQGVNVTGVSVSNNVITLTVPPSSASNQDVIYYEISYNGNTQENVSTVFNGFFQNVNYSNPNIFLNNGPQTEPNAQLNQIAAQFNDNRDITTVKQIIDWIHQNIKSVAGSTYDQFGRSSAQIVASGESTGCTDFGLVFATLAREKGIPTVFVQTASTSWIRDLLASSNGTTSYFAGHILAEVFINNEWYLVDPTQGTIYSNYDRNNLSLPDNYYVFAKSLEVWDTGIMGVEENSIFMTRLFKSFDINNYVPPTYPSQNL
jgi:hypothetical protein